MATSYKKKGKETHKFRKKRCFGKDNMSGQSPTCCNHRMRSPITLRFPFIEALKNNCLESDHIVVFDAAMYECSDGFLVPSPTS
jgi:hypothetical protein